jgi:hypothetical protein
MNKKEFILETYPDETFMFADGYDDAILGISEGIGEEPRIVYSHSKIIDILKKDMSTIEAIEFFNFNIGGAYVGKQTPIFVYDSLLN